jgi:hypothetical protein
MHVHAEAEHAWQQQQQVLGVSGLPLKYCWQHQAMRTLPELQGCAELMSRLNSSTAVLFTPAACHNTILFFATLGAAGPQLWRQGAAR